MGVRGDYVVILSAPQGFAEASQAPNQGDRVLKDTVGHRSDAACGRNGSSFRPLAARSLTLVILTSSIFMAMTVAAMPAMAANGDGDGTSNSTRLAVLIVTILAFAAAAFEGRRVFRSPQTSDLAIRDDLIDIDLLARWPRSLAEPRIVRVLENVFVTILILYAAFDRGFAWFHIPGTPLFVGEITLLIGAWAMMSSPVGIRAAIRQSPALKVLIGWMVWGFIFLVLQIPTYGIDTVRDSALWYYGAAAIITVFLLQSDASRLGRWIDLYAKVLPFLLLWFPVAMALDTLFGDSAPYVPDSSVPFFDHRFGNIAVHSGIALGFIWLVDRELKRFSTSQRIAYTALATVGFLIAGFQNRGGLVSVAIGIAVMMVFLRQRKGEMVLAIAAVVILLGTFAIVTDIRIPISSSREISAAQMVDNIGSVIDPSSGERRQTGTTEWRLTLWTAVLNDVIADRPFTGFGPGPDLGARYGVTTNKDVPLRNPHNSHVGVLARMGLVGIAFWLIMWIVWAVRLLLLRNRLRQHGRSVEAGFAAWLLVSALMILTNAIFDPTLEGPHVGFWLWTVFGIGVALPLFYSGHGGKMPIDRGRVSETDQHADPNSVSKGPKHS